MDDWCRVCEVPLVEGEEVIELKPSEIGLLAKTSLSRMFIIDVEACTIRQIFTQPPSYEIH